MSDLITVLALLIIVCAAVNAGLKTSRRENDRINLLIEDFDRDHPRRYP